MDASSSTPLLSEHWSEPPIRTAENDAISGGGQYSSDVDESLRDTTSDSKRRIGVSDGIALVLGSQIGSGIFSSPTLVALSAGSESAALFAWLTAGTLAWSCAACYIELSNHIPMNGGPQEFLAICFGDLYGFVAGWSCIFVAKPCSGAMLALVLSDYLCDAAGLHPGESIVERKLVAFCIILSTAFVNCLGNKQSNAITKLFLACKLVSVGFVLIMGLSVLMFPNWSKPTSPHTTTPTHGSEAPLRSFADAMLVAMWAYSGWETLSFVGGEVTNPERNIAIVINVSMAIVVSLFLLANVSYFVVLSFAGVVNSQTVGLTFSRHFLGDAGAAAYIIAICLSGIGSLNVKIFTAGRLTQAAADRRFLPKILSTVGHLDHEDDDKPREAGIWRGLVDSINRPVRYKDGTIPLSSIIFNTFLTMIYITVGEFADLVKFIGTVEYTTVFLTLMGLLRIRNGFKIHIRGSTRHAMPQNPLWLIVVASLAVVFMLLSSLSKHPLTGLGLALFSIAVSIFYKFVIQPNSRSEITEPLD
ncbi:hypothetical protein TWF696_008926 [Orbilia brochopaga]